VSVDGLRVRTRACELGGLELARAGARCEHLPAEKWAATPGTQNTGKDLPDAGVSFRMATKYLQRYLVWKRPLAFVV